MHNRIVCQRYISKLFCHFVASQKLLSIQSTVLLSFICCFTELPITIVKGIEPVKTTVNERIELECEVSEEGAHVKW